MGYPAEEVPSTTLAHGEVLADAATGSRFIVTGYIGKGERGEVYLGQAQGSGDVVAIKTIPLALVADPKIALRTQFESRALRQLCHRNVVKVRASGVREDGVIFMVMEYLPGVTLRTLRRTLGKIPIAWALRIVRDACLGLIAIHPYAVHRDLKPANLHFGVDGVVRVLDLGLARWNRSGMRITTTGMAVGSLAYMAPEVLEDAGAVGAQADIWSLGVVLFELLADRYPFVIDGVVPDSPYLLGCSILDQPHPPLRDLAPLCPGSLAMVVDKMLAKDPGDRYRSAVQVVQVLCAEIERFERMYGAAPPLEELAAQIFPGAPRQPVALQNRVSAAVAGVLKQLESTVRLDPRVRPAQASALAYMRTEGIPPELAAAVRAAAQQAPRASPAPELRLSPEPEPPRVSDVYLRRPRLPQANLPVVAPPIVPEPNAPSWRRVALVAGGALVLVAAGVAAVAAGSWALPAPSSPVPVDTGAPVVAPPPAPSATAVATAAPSSTPSAAPSASASPPRRPAVRPSPTHSTR